MHPHEEYTDDDWTPDEDDNKNPTWQARLTSESEAEQDVAINALVLRLNQFSSGENRACPVCQKPVEKITCWHGIDTRVLYVRPCNCRLGVWEDAPKWAREAGLVEDDTSFFDEAVQEPTCGELREMFPDEDWSDCEDNPIDYKAQEDAGQKRLPGMDE